MLKSMVVILAMFGSVAANAGLVTGSWDAVQDQKAVGGLVTGSWDAIQDQKAVSIDSQVETAQLLDLNEGF